MLSKFDYVKPQLLTEALDYLKQNDGTRIMAGGTDLMIVLRHNAEMPQHIIDIKAIPETNRMEGYKFSSEGRLMNPSFTDNKIPTAKDIPIEIIPILIENPQPDGPFGARGVGEHPMISVPSVIGNALYDALGINFYKLPLSPENVALAIAKKMK